MVCVVACPSSAGLPGFITPPSSVGVPQGGVGVFTCVVGSNPPGNTSWLFEGAVLQSSEKYLVLPERLEVAGVQTADEGYYECLASNVYGSAPASARLSIVNGKSPPLAAPLLPAYPLMLRGITRPPHAQRCRKRPWQ